MSDFNQLHFEIVRITAPSVTGVCTVGDSLGFGTPLTCDQPSNSTKTYSFTNEFAPMIPEQAYKQIKSISETPTKLESGKGLSSRGTFNIILKDFKGDPNMESPALIDDPTIEKNGTYLAKLNARNIFANRDVVIELHTEESYPVPVQTRRYKVEYLQDKGNGTWSLKGKDVLSAINFDEYQFPSNEAGFLRTDIDETTTTIPVDTSTYTAPSVVLVGDEFMTVTGVSNIGSGSATLTVKARGSVVGTPQYTQTLSRTDVDSHSGGDSVFICTVSDNQRIDDFIELVLLDAEIDPALIANSKPQWTSEVDEWHPSTRINTIWYKQEDGNKVLSSVLTDFMMDIWYDPTQDLIKISAISKWKTSNSKVAEDRQITYNTFKYSADDTLRSTRAYAVFNKKYLARSDDIENFANVSFFKDSILESSDYYGEQKAFRFPNSRLLDSGSADLLTKRYVNRFGLTPINFNWSCEERFLDFNIGDVVDVLANDLQSASGNIATDVRAQILSITPKYNGVGRTYTVQAKTYSPEFESTDIIYRNFETMNNINLFNEAGRPNTAVDLTFVFDGVKIGSTDANTPAMRAGNFVAGSTLTIIYINGTDHQAKGGDGGSGGGSEYDQETGTWWNTPPTAGKNGGNCYDDDGIATTIYLSGSTGNATYPTSDGYLRAPAGGGGGSVANNEIAGDGGGGGAGIQVGIGGPAGIADRTGSVNEGKTGNNGTETGTGGLSNGLGGKGGNWGENGTSSAAAGGNKGKGLAGTVTTIEGATAARFINGGGEPSL